jgi:hypothetical protein
MSHTTKTRSKTASVTNVEEYHRNVPRKTKTILTESIKYKQSFTYLYTQIMVYTLLQLLFYCRPFRNGFISIRTPFYNDFSVRAHPPGLNCVLWILRFICSWSFRSLRRVFQYATHMFPKRVY